jgi:hypothetical protein
LEPLVCDVCGQPCEGLHLCTGGHLAHAACLAPQCVDCKREFCQLCAAQIAECVVCHRPVCMASLIQCPTCGRGTCSEHQQLCHAADGEPAILPEPAMPEDEAAASTPPPAQQPDLKPPAQIRSKSRDATSARNAAARRSKPKTSPAAKRTPTAKGVRIDVQIYEGEPIIVAFVMRSTNRVLATRSIALTPQGILIHCDCEKDPCPASGYFYRPAPTASISEQVAGHLRKLQQEYLVPAKKVLYYSQRFGQLHPEKRLVLPAAWRDPALLTEARRGFDRLGSES